MQDSHNRTDFLMRWCGPEEINWVNEQYRKVNFHSSNLDTDRIAIAICQGERVGLGRLCQIEGFVFELGGMYIQPDYRKLGLARQLVRFLLKDRDPKARVYCLPFTHLTDFYLSEGFGKVASKDLSKVPCDILEKHRWCNKTYLHEVLLLQLH